MKKIEYMKPAVRVKFVMIQAPLCESIEKDDQVEGDADPFSKDADFEDENYSAFDLKSVWDD